MSDRTIDISGMDIECVDCTKQPSPRLVRFYSNCLFEAILAKLRNHRCQIHWVSPVKNWKESRSPFPHWYWSIDGFGFCFFASHRLKWYETLWHEGAIVCEYRGLTGIPSRRIDRLPL